MSKAELWFYRKVSRGATSGAILFVMPSLFLLVFLMGECIYWLSNAHWIRITLCTLGNFMRWGNRPVQLVDS
jgi:hypothetical protein